jgi:hypothetical protein
MGFLKIIQGAFTFINAWMRGQERKANEEAGANKADLATRKANDETEEFAKNVRKRKSSSPIKSSGVSRDNNSS